MNLTTAERYFTLFPASNAANQDAGKVAQINARISAISAKVQRYLSRKTEVAERTELFTPESGLGTLSIRLSAYPVTEIDTLTVYGDIYTAENSDFTLDSEMGVVSFSVPVSRDAVLYQNGISVKYTGGMADDTADFISKYPDIESLVLDQVFFELQRMQNIANKSIAGPSSSAQLNEYGLMPALADCLDDYRMRILP